MRASGLSEAWLRAPPSRRETPAGTTFLTQPGDLQLRFPSPPGCRRLPSRARSPWSSRAFMPGGKLGRGRVWGELSLPWLHLASRPQRCTHLTKQLWDNLHQLSAANDA
ncbi:unnamed protein product, partial [Rangifer tarandus platyrhynchus]